MARSLFWEAKAPELEVFAFGDLSEVRLDPSEEDKDRSLGGRSKSGDSEQALKSWKKSTNYTTFLAARKALSHPEYQYFLSSLSFAREIACKIPVDFMEELVLLYEPPWRGNWVKRGTGIAIPSFKEIANKATGFALDVDRLAAAYSSFSGGWGETIGGDNSWVEVVGSSEHMDLGNPKPFLEALGVGECPTAGNEAQRWAALIAKLKHTSDEYSQSQAETKNGE